MSQEDTIASEVIAASLGGAISASVLYPLEVLKTKMQAAGGDDEEDTTASTNDSKPQNPTMVQYASALYEREGAGVFFRGVETSAFQSATEKALYFFAYQALKDMHAGLTGSTQLDGLSNLVLGCAAEWAHLPITLPFDCWTTLIQTTKDETPMALLCNLLAAGPSKMYKGIQAYTVLCLKPALQYTIFEQVKTVMVKGRVQKTLTAVEAFLLGMVARTIATVVVFPYLRAKVMLQAAKASAPGNTTCEQKSVSIPTMLGTMYSSGGFASWFQGLGPELTRGVLSAALMMMIKEKISVIVKQAIVGHAAAAQEKKDTRGRLVNH
jgi:solute carrier family 25 (peroxisomal adenine nucleotide transporter), member 17